MKNNEDSKKFPFTFYLGITEHKDTIEKIREYRKRGFDSQSDLVKKAVIQFFEISGKKKSLKDEKLEQEIIKLKIENKLKLIRDMDVAPTQANELIEKPESFNLGFISSKDILQSDNKLRCKTCGILFEVTDDYNQTENYRLHVEKKHNRGLFEDERKVMMGLLGN